MSNLDNLINKAKGFINLAGKKTGDIVEISKLKILVVIPCLLGYPLF